MTDIGMIHIVYPIANAAEKEYVKKFFRFIGCFISDCPVDETIGTNWGRYLFPYNEKNGIDIILNYYGKDPYQVECSQHGIKRFYLYFHLDKKSCAISHTPLLDDKKIDVYDDKKCTRKKALKCLVNAIWLDRKEDYISVSRILDLYIDNKYGDLFYFLQAKRSLRVLNMGEVLQDPDAQVSFIPLSPYIKRMLSGLWEIYVKLGDYSDVYSAYTQVNTASIIREIVKRIDENDYSSLQDIRCGDEVIKIFSVSELMAKSQKVLERNPQYTSVYLLMASLCKSAPRMDRGEEACYLRALRSIPHERKGYAFIWYRIGYFYEKVHGDPERALENYRRAYQADPKFYQAIFKLGYYAALEGRYNEAESLLNTVIKTIFHGRSPDPDEKGEYKNWLTLSLKDSQYVYKAYILLAKIAIKNDRNYSAKSFVGKACLAATNFEEAALVEKLSDLEAEEFNLFIKYHKESKPVWCIWRVLKPWSEYVVQDAFVRHVVLTHLGRWN